MRSGKRQPSDHLLALLQAEDLAARCDLDRCAPLVRSLAAELPDFDSVWLDAMVRLRQLTPWQAEQLQLTPPGTLSIGRFLACEPLGEHSLLALERQSGQKFVLSRASTTVAAAGTAPSTGIRQLLDGISVIRQRKPNGCILPTELAEDLHGQLWLASPYVGNWSLEDLLIRGGRLPWTATAEIGRELLMFLVWFEKAGLAHGNLTLTSVRVCSAGRIFLLSAFARRLRRPGISIGQQLTVRDCEGFAPELAECARQPDRRSELYALGCLLWQLLTGRPVVISADPVRRLISHRDHDIPDVRSLVPECPEWLAHSIQMLTRRLPELRPDSAAETLRHWTAAPQALSAVRRVAQSLPESRRTVTLPPGPIRQTQSRTARLIRNAGWPAAAVATLTGLGIIASQSAPQLLPLNIGDWRKLLVAENHTTELPLTNNQPAAKSQDAVLDMPLPDADGLIQLQSGKTYRPRNVRIPGRLTIECSSQDGATVEIPAHEQWILAGSAVELKGLQVKRSSGSTTPETPRQLAAVQCSSLRLQHCQIQSPAAADDCSGLAWFRPAQQPGIIELRNCVFAGGGYGISCNHPPQKLQLENVLLASRGGGLLLEFGKQDSSDWQLTLKNVTQRFGFSLIDTIIHADGPTSLALQVISEDCVYQPRMAVIRIRPPAQWQPADMQIRFQTESGHPAIVQPDAEAAVYIDRALNQTVALPDESLPDNMLLFVDSTFRDSEQQHFSNPYEASVLLDFDGPKLSHQLPGIIAEQMPASPAASYFTN